METEKLNDLIEKWENNISRLYAIRDFHVFGKDFDKVNDNNKKIEVLVEFIEDLKQLLKT